MNKKKIIKIAGIIILIGFLIGGGVVYYLFNMPHRNITAAKTDIVISADMVVNEFLTNPTSANDKYLDEEGESKILEVNGIISSINKDFNGNTEIVLKSNESKAGVSCTFTAETNSSTVNLTIEQPVSIKGVIRSGASFDADLEMYENVIMEKCSIANKN